MMKLELQLRHMQCQSLDMELRMELSSGLLEIHGEPNGENKDSSE